MKSWELLNETHTVDGSTVRLMRHDDEYVILASGKPLMSSRSHGSEEALAKLGCRRARTMKQPRVLVGGLGMGFTLRAALDVLPSGAVVTVSELVPAVLEWNRGPLGSLAAHPLRDPRVRIQVADVGFTVRAHSGGFDVVLLDVDNGPAAFTAAVNEGLYDNGGVAAVYAALRPGGMLAVWSAWEDRGFEQRLRHHGFMVEVERVRVRSKKGGARHTIFLGSKHARDGGCTMDDRFVVSCPYCGEDSEIYVEPDVRGSFVQDCEVCCNPWRVRVSGEGSERQIDVRRADGSE